MNGEKVKNAETSVALAERTAQSVNGKRLSGLMRRSGAAAETGLLTAALAAIWSRWAGRDRGHT
jgi:hypothetical protein